MLTKGRRRAAGGFFSGFAIGSLGGMIGLGGAEFRLPLLVGFFRLKTLEAIILNKATSLVVVSSALLARSVSIPLHALWPSVDVVLNLLAGSLVGAWWAAGHTMSMPRKQLDRVVLLLLIGLGVLMLAEAWIGIGASGTPMISDPVIRAVCGVGAGLLIGMVAAILGVAGGELLIPTIVLLYGIDIKLAGSLSLVVSLPTMLVGFMRYRSADAFSVLHSEASLFKAMTAGSMLGAVAGGLMLGLLSSSLLASCLGVLLLFSAWKTFNYDGTQETR